MLPESPSFRLEGRRAVVTGAGRGIGLAAATALARAGAAVTLAARTVEEIESASALLRAEHLLAEAVPLDVTDVAAVSAFFATRPAFHVLVNNAGTNRVKDALEITEADYDTVLDLNLRSAFFVAQSCARRMVEQGIAGSLVHMGSQMGHVGGPRRALYCASKWGLEGLNKALSLDLAHHGIRSNTIAPTFIETPLTRPMLADATFRQSVLDKIKLGRVGQVSDVMGAIVYLASDASALVTGTSLLIDGGWTAD
jgi:NAD(P)-dependent dehydrogenase (short-subunit alcohol dehydrogenase family)